MWNYVVNVDLVEIVGGWVEDRCWNWWMVVVRHRCSRYRWMISFRYRKGVCRSRGRNRYRWYGLWMICIDHWCRWMVRFRYCRWMYRYRRMWHRYWSWWATGGQVLVLVGTAGQVLELVGN